VLPPEKEMENLIRLVMEGDIFGIQQETERIRSLNSDFAPFAERVCQLSKQFQIKKIREFIQINK
jgi:hypothetical protein